jgi:hypothetical protein
MRCALFLWLSLTSVYSAEFKIDHVTVAGSNIVAMREAFTAATTLPTEYGGKHANHATEMALTSFPDGSYLEFMAIQPQADAAANHVWSKFLSSNAGPCAFALRVPDLSAEVAQLRSAGMSVKSPEPSGRTRPDGVRLQWETTDIGSGRRGGLFPFLIHDLTPREKRVFLTGKATTENFSGISKVVIGVADLNAAIAQYRRAFKLPPPRLQRDTEFDAELAWFEGTPIVLAQGLSDDSWLTRRVHQYGDAPCAFVLVRTGGLAGNPGPVWFGHTIFWEDEKKLGWRLGLELSR